MRSLLAAALTTLTCLALLAPSALGHDGGQGLYGETNDKVVTDAGFILIIFFPLFILLMSLAQARLDKRKEARKAAHKAQESSGEPRGGW
jgi:ABC-type nickel/cobalt efflux system permease component RcnA